MSAWQAWSAWPGLSLAEAWRLSQLLLAWSLFVQVLEYLRMDDATQADGLWSWALQRRDIPREWQRQVLDHLYAPHVHRLHLWLRLGLLIAWLVHSANPLWISLLFGSQLTLFVRWRGAFNGGSDFLTLVALTGQLAGTWLHHLFAAEWAWQAGLWYVSLQAITSYFISGWVKWLRPEWRRGEAMTIFLNAAIYGPLPPAHPLRSLWLARLGSWAFMGWECVFPLALLQPGLALVFCGVAAVFHFLVFWYFGLNRFFWAWIAAFPAIVWSAGQSWS